MAVRRALKFAAAVAAALALIVTLTLIAALIRYPAEYVWRVLAWRQSTVDTYLHGFPHSWLTAAAVPFRWPVALDEERVGAAVRTAFDVADVDAFLTTTATQAFIVIQDDAVVFEWYRDGYARDTLVTSFSVAKSFVSTLVGIAIEDGLIDGLDAPVTRYLPELAERDRGFERITIRHLLTMSSGLDYRAMRPFVFAGDDPLSSYHPDQRLISLTNTRIVEAPGTRFSYNKYQPQLLGLILERTTGMTVTEWTQRRIWDPVGMEFDGSWSLDSTTSGFEKMEAGLNGRAIDFAKLGRLFLAGGSWDGRTIVSREWVDLAWGIDPAGRAPRFDDVLHYGLMWWGVTTPDGRRDAFAAGDRGQFVYVAPSSRLIAVRTGIEYGIPFRRWIDGFARLARDLAPDTSRP